MKKSILLAVMIFFLQLAGFSQKPWIGFQAGWGLSNMVLKDNYGKSASDMAVGFTTGVLIDCSLSERISIQPSVNFSQKGGKINNDLGYGKATEETVLNYLDIPVNVIFYSQPAKLGFFAGAGVNFGFGLSGFREIADPVYQGWFGDEVEDVNFGNGEDDPLKPFDLGANLLFGYSCKRGLFFSFTGNFGLANVSNQNDSKIKNNYFAFRVGWLIPRKS